ncbi:MAG TPA: tetratricopeptide repeat protein [Verrucomicrobiae bacterium]|nr:tetratricopeptide repeat protein [Verrucomicrobiae bacterium]
MPVILLVGLELILRLAGYGYSTGFFQNIRVGDKDYLVNNEDFGRRFFPPQLMRWPGPVMFEAKKPANTFRIFILGESAARGEPEPACAASRYLEALLDERFPNTHFEVINLGITAIDSHVILPIARDCAGANGDLWIIYMGNNEMVGPFGAATVFGTKAPSVGLVRLNLALKNLRLGQLLLDVASRFAKHDASASWGGLNMFVGNQLSPDDTSRTVVYRNFQRNLDDIVRVGLDSGAKILLNTVSVNLKDCPPFASLTNNTLAASDAAQFQKLFSEGCRAEEQNDFPGAAEKFEAAAKLDPQFAELQFRWAECLAQTGNASTAREHFQQAGDDDALPFRADSHINGIVAAAGKKFAGDRMAFFDALAALAAETTNEVCGQETFFEHVHFNIDGNFRLGRFWAAQMEKVLPQEILRNAATNGWASQTACERRLGFTDANRCAIIQEMIGRLGRPPFNNQLNNAARLRSLREQAAAQCHPMAAQAAMKIYRSAIQRTPADFLLYKNFAEYLESTGDLQQALVQWQKVCELLPHYCDGFHQVGRLLNDLGRWDQAEAPLRKALALRPQLTEAWYEMGIAYFGRGNFDPALQEFKHAAQLEPSNATYLAMEGRALSKLQRRSEAIQRYREALQIQPNLVKVWLSLGDELVSTNQISDARDAYAEAVRLEPENALAHLDLGVMFARLNQFDDALEQFEATLRLDPGNQPARDYLNRVQNWKQKQILNLK